jgi:hypothetical protein
MIVASCGLRYSSISLVSDPCVVRYDYASGRYCHAWRRLNQLAPQARESIREAWSLGTAVFKAPDECRTHGEWFP